MGQKLKILIIGILLAMLLVGLLPTAILADQSAMSATGTITSISETLGFPVPNSSYYIVTSRTVMGYFTSGDLTGSYSLNYKAAVDLYTQAGYIYGQLSADSYLFNVAGQSYPVQWSPDSTSPTGYIGTSTASGVWQLQNGGTGNGNFSCTFSFMPTADGHIDYILPGSTFSLWGQWNIN